MRMGLGHFTASAKPPSISLNKSLDIARLPEVPALENYNLAESLTRQSLQTFEDRRLQADAPQTPRRNSTNIASRIDAATTAAQFCLEAANPYQQLDIEVDC